MQTYNLTVRSEKIGDEDAIADVIYQAFGDSYEAQIVDNVRKFYHAYSRKYAVVALIDDEIVGHTLFTPCRVKLRGRFVQALLASPVSVIPEHQRNGIGAEMLKFGHALGAKNGFDMCFLLGHPRYYPRLGYKPCFGFSEGTFDLNNLPAPKVCLVPSPVTQADVPWLVTLFEKEFKDIEFSWHWGAQLHEWVIDAYDSVIWRTKEGRRVAYSVARTETKRFKLMLAEDGYHLRQMIFKVRPEILFMHRAGWLGKQLAGEPWISFKTWFDSSAMAIDLGTGVLDEFVNSIDFEHDEPGFSAFPLAILE